MGNLLESLGKIPERETGGKIAIDRFDFQTCWGVAHLLELHASTLDYGIAFEFHDDIIVVDSIIDPSKIRFFQLKTKTSGTWDVSSIFNKPGGKSSIVEKMLDNKDKFGPETSEIILVSNQPCGFLKIVNQLVAFSDSDEETRKKILKYLQHSRPAFCESDLEEIFFLFSELNLPTYENAVLGQFVNFITETCNLPEGNFKGFYLSLVDQCRKRSKKLADTSDLKSLLASKFLTRDEVKTWLEALVRRTIERPKWAEVEQKLVGIPPMKLRAWHKGWKRYYADVIARADIAFLQFSKFIQQEIDSIDIDTADSVPEIVMAVLPKVKVRAKDVTTEIDNFYLIGAILYEFCYNE